MAEPEDTSYTHLPTIEQCIHTAWKARLNGYELAAKDFSMWDRTDKQWQQYQGYMKQFVSDSNAVALDKGLDAALVFAENAGCAGKVAGEMSGAAIQKCFGAPKEKTRTKARDLLLMFVEIDKPDVVVEEVVGGFSNKNPKVKISCLQFLCAALEQFGAKIFTLKNVLKQLPPMLEDRDKTVREESRRLAVLLIQLVGAKVRTELGAALKPAQMNEIESDLTASSGAPTPTRYTRSQQAKLGLNKPRGEAQSVDEAGTAEEDTAFVEDTPVVDTWESLEPVDITALIPSRCAEFNELLESKKWSERKQALEALLTICEQNPRFDPKIQYGDLVQKLKELIGKDANINVVALAAKCLAAFANGLRKKFGQFALMCAPVLFDKFKEKKTIVRDALRDAIDALAGTTTLEGISEEAVKAVGNKNPQIKSEASLFLARRFASCNETTLNKKLLKVYTAALMEAANDQDPSVREAAMEALGAAMRAVSEKNIKPFIADLDANKMAKVKDFSSAASTKAAPAAPEPAKAAPAAAPAPAKRPAAASAKPKPDTAAAKKAPPKASAVEDRVLSDDEVAAAAAAFFGEATVTVEGSDGPPKPLAQAVDSSNFKERLAAVQKVSSMVQSSDPAALHPQMIIRFVTGLNRESNVQVINAKLELYRRLATDCSAAFSEAAFTACMSECVEKIHEKKLNDLCMDALHCSAEALQLSTVGNKVLEYAFDNQKNPKVQAEILVWLAKALADFGMKFDTKNVVAQLKKATAASNPDVRAKAVAFIGVLYIYIGSQVRMFFDGEKAQLLAQIDAECAKHEGEKPPAPTRGLRQAQAQAATAGGGETAAPDVEDDAPEEINVADLVDRVDITPQLTDELKSLLSDSNWKMRKEGIDNVQRILNDAKYIAPSLSYLPEVLKQRLAESNKNLVSLCLDICQTLVTAVGPKLREHSRTLLAPVIQVLTDSKPQLRQKAIGVLNSWRETCGFRDFLEGEIIPEALKGDNPNLRADFLHWLAQQLPEAIAASKKKLPDADVKASIPYIFAALEDRNGEVRKGASEFLPIMMQLVAYEEFKRRATDLKPASQKLIFPLLEKARSEMPAAKPAQQEAPAASQKAAASAKKTNAAQKAASPGKKDAADEGTALVVAEAAAKQQRFVDENKMKVLKWQFTQPRPEYIDQLREQLATVCKPALLAQLFHLDFKQHLKAIEALNQQISVAPDSMINALDLFLKWTTLRFFDTNPSVLLKCLELIQAVLLLLEESEMSLHDNEVGAFVPFLLMKSGESKDIVRTNVRSILGQICHVYPASKLFPYLMEASSNKNARQRAECLEFMGHLIESNGLGVCQPSAKEALRAIASQISDKDNSVRNAALNAITVAFFHEGDKVYKMIGSISDKDAVLLSERIKRSTKKGPLIRKPETPAPKGIRGGRASSSDGTPLSMNGDAGLQNGEVEDVEELEEQPRRRRQFEIDWDYVGASPMVPEDYAPLELTDLSEVYAMMNEPVNVYQIKSRIPAHASKQRLLSSSTQFEAGSTIDAVITQVASNQIETSIQALAQLDELLKDNEKARLLSGHIDPLIQAIYFQLRLVYNTHMITAEPSKVIALYRNLGATLLSMVNHADLIREASETPLRDLIYNLITVLLDDRVESMPDGPYVIRSINVMVVKLVDSCDPTRCMVALLRLLFDCVSSEACSAKFQELVMKCIWKHSRLLQKVICDLDVTKILLEMQRFFEAFPPEFWRQRQQDTPFRTIKTVLHTAVKLMGNDILPCVESLPPDSAVVTYVHKYLKTVDAGAAKVEPNTTVSLAVTDPYRQPLKDIFKKIGSKENTKQGIQELFDFKQLHPKADLSPYMEKSSEYFRSYVEKGLAQVEQERRAQAREVLPPSSAGVAEEMEQNVDIPNAEALMNRLNEMRRRAGMTVNNSDNNNAVVQPTGLQASKHMERLRQLRSEIGLEPQAMSVRRPSDSSSDVELNVASHAVRAARTPEKQPVAPVSQYGTPTLTPDELQKYRERLAKVRKGAA